MAACGGDEASRADASVKEESPATSAETPTWFQDVRPIVHQKCGSCHRPEAIAPFSVMDYESAKPFAKLMLDAVESGRMPPFFARETPECTPKHPFANDPRLTESEKGVLRAWANGGAPAGDKSKPAAVQDPPSVTIGRADVVMKLPTPILVEQNDKGSDLHTCLIVDPKIEKDGYVVSRQVTSGNPKVLHHVTTYIVSPSKTDGTAVTRDEMNEMFMREKKAKVGERYDCFGGPTLDGTGLTYSLLGSWAPGGAPVNSPPDSGQPVKAGSVVVLDLHYHPIPSGPETDSATEYALQFADTTPKFVATPIFMGFADGKQPIHNESSYGTSDLVLQPGETTPEFIIPAGATKHVEEFTHKWKLPFGPIQVYFASSHMHYAGRDLMVQLENAKPAAGEDPMECLERTPSWDFNWQLGYSWDATREQWPTIHDGDTIHVRCTYDNSLGNKFIADALSQKGMKSPVDIRVGEDTLDEMCLSLMGITYANPNYTP
jgi:hypothetical protein